MRWTFWLYAVCCAPWAACLLLYGLRSRWRASRVGRAMLATYASLTAVLGLAAVLRVVHLPWPLTLALALTTLGAVAAAGCVQLIAIVRAQARDRRIATEETQCPSSRT